MCVEIHTEGPPSSCMQEYLPLVHIAPASFIDERDLTLSNGGSVTMW